MQNSLIIDVSQADIYQQDKLILQNVNFTLATAEFCYLVGKTGSGKSSLLKTLYAANRLRKGQANVVGYDLADMSQKEIPLFRRKLGMIFQDFKLFTEWTVGQNLAYVLKATDWKDKVKIRARIEEVITLVNLEDKLDTLVAAMSGGEQQRLAIARAILNEPVLLIADEPTGNLDPDSSDEILYLLKQLTDMHKMATIFATHDYRVMDKFPARVYRCIDQTIKEEFN